MILGKKEEDSSSGLINTNGITLVLPLGVIKIIKILQFGLEDESTFNTMRFAHCYLTQISELFYLLEHGMGQHGLP